MHKSASGIFVTLFLLAGCAGDTANVGFDAGQKPQIGYIGSENPPAKPVRFDLNGSVSDVVDRLVDALEGPRFGITRADRREGLITANYRADPEQFVDCGVLDLVSSDGTPTQIPAARRQVQYQVGLRGGTYGIVNRNLKLDGRMLIDVKELNPRRSQVTISGDYVLTRTLRLSGKPGDPIATIRQLIDFGSGLVGSDAEGRLRCQSNGELESYLLASLRSSGDRGAADEALGAAVDPDAPLLTRVESQFEKLSCSPLTARSLGGSDVIVNGFVSSAEELERLESLVRSVAGIGEVIFRVSITSPAFCTILDVTLPLKDVNGVDQAGAFVRLANSSFNLIEGEYLVVDATSPSYESHVYLFYAQQDGKLVHMLPNPEQPDILLPANQNFRVGDEPDFRRYSIAPPFGDDMVTLIASTKPLFPDPRPEIEPISALASDLPDLVADAQANGANVVADILFVTTSPRSF